MALCQDCSNSSALALELLGLALSHRYEMQICHMCVFYILSNKFSVVGVELDKAMELNKRVVSLLGHCNNDTFIKYELTW